MHMHYYPTIGLRSVRQTGHTTLCLQRAAARLPASQVGGSVSRLYGKLPMCGWNGTDAGVKFQPPSAGLLQPSFLAWSL
jgi:hypothetical protein